MAIDWTNTNQGNKMEIGDKKWDLKDWLLFLFWNANSANNFTADKWRENSLKLNDLWILN